MPLVLFRHARENGHPGLISLVLALSASGCVNRRRWFFPPWIPVWSICAIMMGASGKPVDPW